MPIEIDEKDRAVLQDLITSKGGTLEDLHFAVEALSHTGKRKRREFRLAKMYLSVIRRLAMEPREWEDMERIVDLAGYGLVGPLGMAAPDWEDRRLIAKLQVGGHTPHCATGYPWRGCGCGREFAHVGQLPPWATAAGFMDWEVPPGGRLTADAPPLHTPRLPAPQWPACAICNDTGVTPITQENPLGTECQCERAIAARPEEDQACGGCGESTRNASGLCNDCGGELSCGRCGQSLEACASVGCAGGEPLPASNETEKR